MLIYVNQFRYKNADIDKVFKSIAGWLKGITKQHINYELLKTNSEKEIDRMWIRTFSAVDAEPCMHSILFTHPDKAVNGRQWITEIGVKKEGGDIFLSILLETSDVSTQVKEVPTTTRPRLVNYLEKNLELDRSTIGLKEKILINDIYYFRGLKDEILNDDRDYPIVLVSVTSREGKYLVDYKKLQAQLLGLAQVYVLDESINSWELENFLTKNYSSWDGAINIISPRYKKSFSHNKLLSRAYIENLKYDGVHIIREILSHITHMTNGFNKKKHFSPTDLRAKRQKDKLLIIKSKFNALLTNEEYRELAEEAFKDLEEQNSVIEKLQADLDRSVLENLDLIDESDSLKNELSALHYRVSQLQTLKEYKNNASPLIVKGEEVELFEGEFGLMTLKILKNYSRDLDITQRRKKVLEDIISNNSIYEGDDLFLDKIKKIFSNYDGVTPRIQQELKGLNLEIVEGKTHTEIRIIGEPRFEVSFAKTPSDKSRVGFNIARDIKKTLL